MQHRHNWAGNYTYRAARWHQPRDVEELQALVRRSRKLRILGSRHSFNAIADTSDDLVSLEHFDAIGQVDRARQTVTVGGGVRYGEMCGQLQQQGYALRNLASLPHISVAGACATATHGSGVRNGNLATAVAAMELVTGDGERITVSREHDGDRFCGMVVGLGALGAVTQLTLDVVPSFALRQDVYESMPFREVLEHFDEIVSSAYSVSLFTDWRGERFNQVWVKREVDSDTATDVERVWFGAALASEQRHPIDGLSGENCTLQLGVPGPWHERLPHFRMEFTPSSGVELQSEYFVARQHAVDALHALAHIREQIAPLLMVAELRTVAADELWMSPCYGQDCVALHFTWQQNWPALRALLPTIEAALAPWDPRPHWGKLFTLPPARVQASYPKLPAFRDLLQQHDPDGVFRNEFVETLVVNLV